MEADDLQYVKASAGGRPAPKRWCCFKAAPSIAAAPTDRTEVAKERWRRVLKLRFLLAAVDAAKKQVNKVEQEDFLGKVSSLYSEDQKLTEKKCLLYPWNPVLKGFEVICAVLILYFCFATPFHIGFQSYIEHPIVYELVFDAVLFVGIWVRFFVAYIDNFEVVDDRWQIAKRYLKGTFIFDLISVIPFYLINSYLMWLKIFRLLHISRITQLLGLSEEVSRRLSVSKVRIDWHTKVHLKQMTELLLYLLVTCNFVACIWNYVAIEEEAPLANTWRAGMDMNTIEAYTISFYYTVVTFATVGYGDVTAKTSPEYAVSMAWEFVGIMFFAYLVSNVTSVVNSINVREQMMSQRENDLDKWLQALDDARPDNPIDPELFAAIRNHFTYIWKHDHSSMMIEQEYMMRLPIKERLEFLRMIFSDEVTKFSPLFGGLTDDFAFHMVTYMSPRKFSEGEVAIKADQPVNDLFLISGGEILIGTRSGTKNFLLLPARSYFGDDCIIFQERPKFMYR